MSSETVQSEWRRGGPGKTPIDRVGFWDARADATGWTASYRVESLHPLDHPFQKNSDGHWLQSIDSIAELNGCHKIEFRYIGPLPGSEPAYMPPHRTYRHVDTIPHADCASPATCDCDCEGCVRSRGGFTAKGQDELNAACKVEQPASSEKRYTREEVWALLERAAGGLTPSLKRELFGDTEPSEKPVEPCPQDGCVRCQSLGAEPCEYAHRPAASPAKGDREAEPVRRGRPTHWVPFIQAGERLMLSQTCEAAATDAEEAGRTDFRAMNLRSAAKAILDHGKEVDSLSAALAEAKAEVERIQQRGSEVCMDWSAKLDAAESERDALKAEVERTTEGYSKLAEAWSATWKAARAAGFDGFGVPSEKIPEFIASLRTSLQAAQERIAELEKENAELDRKLSHQGRLLQSRRSQINELHSRLSAPAAETETSGPADHDDHEVAGGYVLGEFTKFLHKHGDRKANQLASMARMLPRLKVALLRESRQ